MKRGDLGFELACVSHRGSHETVDLQEGCVRSLQPLYEALHIITQQLVFIRCSCTELFQQLIITSNLNPIYQHIWCELY